MSEHKTPLAFISYAWSDEAHKGKVKLLVERLRGDGVDAILDQTHLRPGDDMFKFMEQIANNPELKKVVVICDENYKRKVDSRQGGVGTEGSIMSPEVYKQFGEGPNKYVAVAFETDDQGQGYVPTMFSNRLYIDMSTAELLDLNYERLLRFLWDRPEPAAPLGKPPAFLFDADPNDALVHSKARGMHLAVERNRSVLTPWHDFVDAVLAVFGRFTAPLDEQRNYDGAEALRQAEWTIPARDALADAVRFLAREDKLTVAMLVSVFEKLGQLSRCHEQTWSVRGETTAHTRATVMELALYTVAVLIQEDRPDLLAGMLNATYLEDKGYSQVESTVFSFLWNQTDWFGDAYSTQKQRRFRDGTAEWMKDRATLAGLPFSQLVEADVIIAVNAVQALRGDDLPPRAFYDIWYPVLWPYWEYQPYLLFKRLVSETTLKRWLPVFRLETVQEMLESGVNVFKLARRDEFLGNVNPEYAFGVSQLGRRP